MREVISQTLYSYWNDIRAGRLAPKRFEVEPAQIAGMLPDTFILERIDADTSRFRLAGTRICEMFGAEFRGVNIVDLIAPEDRARLKRDIAAIARQGAVGKFVIGCQTASGKTARMEMLLLPLTHMSDSIDRFLGSISPIDRPSWLGHERLVRTNIVSGELVWPDGRPHAFIAGQQHQAPFHPAMTDARIVRFDRRQFRVYDGGLAARDDEA